MDKNVRNKIGFRLPGEDDEAQAVEQSQEAQAAPDTLVSLRIKIGQLAKLMVSKRFSTMRRAERLNVVYDFAELTALERDYSSALIKAGGTA